MAEQLAPILRVVDADAAVAWYGRLGFVKEWEHRFEPGLPLYVGIARGQMRMHLSEHTGYARPEPWFTSRSTTWMRSLPRLG